MPVHLRVALSTPFVAVLALALTAPPLRPQEGSGLRLRAALAPGVEARAVELARPESLSPDVYIVQLSEPPLASYRGGIAGLAPTNPVVTGRARLDPTTPASLAYLDHLAERQASVLIAIQQLTGSTPRLVHTYRYAFDGLALELTPDDARRVAALPGVERVVRRVWRRLLSDAGPAWIGAPGIWDGSATGGSPATQGEGILIGVLDTGINSDHASFADVGGDGFDHPSPPGGLRGRCDPKGPHFDPTVVCNDKLMGQYSYPSSGDDPEDDVGHGSHTASTAGGNALTATILAPTTTVVLPLSGVAPHAHLIAYDVCAAGACPIDAILAGIDDATADGVDVINYSIGHVSSDPWSDLDSLAFLAAVDAGVFVAAAAGNEGPGPATIAAPADAPWVMAAGASTHHRAFVAQLTDLTSDGAALPDIAGRGLTTSLPKTGIVYAGAFPNPNDPGGDPGQCMAPYPPGTFSSRIVLCDRGTIARVNKGGNVLAGGAGGLVLANTAEDGESLVGDPHVLPAVHIGFASGTQLRNWIATNTGAMAAIVGGENPTYDPDLADYMGAFSSRGPTASTEVIKPDLAAPGVDILAAGSDSQPRSAGSDPYLFSSGTSMASPHAAGAAVLLRSLHPAWTPPEIKSALMTTAQGNGGVIKEDGITPADPFDRGAGRVNLWRAGTAALVLDVSTTQFTDANPGTGGDPRTLNLPSMQDSACFISCGWKRTVKNPTGTSLSWNLSYDGPGKASLTRGPGTIPPEGTMALGLDLEAFVLADGWHFGQLELTEASGLAPDVHFPVAFRSVSSTDAGSFTKQVDHASARPGDVLTYTLTASNPGGSERRFDITDAIPAGATYVDSSATGGLVYDAASDSLAATVVVGTSGIEVQEGARFGFIPLAAFGVSPAPFPGNCDNGGFFVGGLDFDYGGQHHTQAIWSVNGTIEPGGASGFASGGANTALPTADAVNNLLAAWWANLDLCSGGSWRAAFLSNGQNDYGVFEWNGVPRVGDNASRATFQIWIQQGSDQIWFAYPASPFTGATRPATVGAENADGTIGDSYYLDGSGTLPSSADDLMVVDLPSAPVAMTFQVTAGGPGVVLNEAEASFVSRDSDRGVSAVVRAFAVTVIEDTTTIFADGFEDGGTSAWSVTIDSAPDPLDQAETSVHSQAHQEPASYSASAVTVAPAGMIVFQGA